MDPNDEIVISGIAGRYPECDTFDEFKQALLEGTDLITENERRFPLGTYDVPTRSGKLNSLEYFDAGYFGISPRQADHMDPRHRIMFETVFEAIVDAGLNPKEIRGTRTGVYVGIGAFDMYDSFKHIEKTYGYTIIGGTLGQIANRTSYCFDFKGPSYILDTACSSALYAFTCAIKAMESGDIDSAIVSGVNTNLHPHEFREFNLLNMLSKDGKCKVFSTERDGYVRSEAIITVLLQKKSNCRRIYSTVLGAEMNCDGFKVEGITFPSSEMQLELINEIYQKKNLNPDDVKYIEMHGTGTPAGDVAECASTVDFFCKNRREPLPIGAVKSNMGHSEVSSGMCSLSKVIIAMETDIIPANLHVNSLDYSLPGLDNGKLKVVTENLPWKGGMVSLNCFGFGGANSHIVLKSNEKPKTKVPRKSHRLVNVSGRTEESVKFYLDKVEERQDDHEFLALIDEIHKMDVEGHTYRGYTVLGENPVREINQISRGKRPIWFIYSGMGSQWATMGKDLLKIEVFRNTFKRCAAALKPYNVDLESVVLSDDLAVFDDIINCFSAIAAIEISLTDLLKSLGIEPDGFAGHSLGEVGCSYCNGDLTPEQAVLLGFARGFATKQSKCAPGQMAAVGMGSKDILKWLPEGIYVACANSSNSTTITGPRDQVRSFVQGLTEKKVFAKLVDTAGYAFHSKYLDDVAPILRDFVKKVIPDPKPRSPKWISSSWKEEEWDHPDSKINSGDYHYHNFKNPVIFEQVYKYIPKDAILIEVAPHGLLMSILKKEMGPEATCLSLVNRNSKDNVQFFSSAIGKLFIHGAQPNLTEFYEKVTFPVSKGTYGIGSLVQWDHSVKWFTPLFDSNKNFGKKMTVNTKDEEYGFLEGHNIDGRVLMAATGYLELVWKVFAELYCKPIGKIPVVFESVKISRATVLPNGQDVVFLVNIMKQSGYFEVFEGGSVCCSGKIKQPKNVSNEFLNPEIPEPIPNGYLPLQKQDVYKLFHLKRYLYTGLFQGIDLVDVNGSYGKLKWNGNFTTFLDTMLQISLVSNKSEDLFLPTHIQKLVIDPVGHLAHISSENNSIPVYYDKELKLIKAGSIELTNWEATLAPRKQIKSNPILESFIFVPYITDSQQNEIDFELSLKMALEIVIENVGMVNMLQASEFINAKDASLIQTVEKIIEREPIVNVSFVDESTNNLDFILCSDGKLDTKALQQLRPDGFLIFNGKQQLVETLGVPIVYQNTYKQKGIFLLRKVTTIGSHEVVKVNNTDFSWISKAQESIRTNQTVFLTSQKDDLSGILGLAKCLNSEPTEGGAVKGIFILDNDAKMFNPEFEFYKKQLSKKLLVNIYKNGVWGSYRYVPVNQPKKIEVAHANNFIQTIGDLSTFAWVERSSHYYKTPCSEYVYVYYSALNFKDVMISTGKIAANDLKDPTLSDCVVGLEYSGITKSGRRVMGVPNVPSISLQVMTDPLFTWDVPSSWSLDEAATVPVVYATCYYAMIIRGQMHNSSSILVHAGAGGIGLAAISIALSMNCEVFTTCGSQEKREFLLKMFPKLKSKNIGNSRSTSFEQMILKNTKGRGVDFVLNSLAADMYQASIRCVAQRGQFLEIGKVDIWAGTPISSSLFAKNTSFHGVLLDDLFDNTSETKKRLHVLVAEGITKGVVRPLPRTVFNEDQVEDAYRFLSTGKHKGKVILKLRNEIPSVIQAPQRTIEAIPKIFFEPEKTYILVGGLGGFGLELTNFLIKRHAKRIVLNSRRGVTNGNQSLCLKRWSELDSVSVRINSDNTSSVGGAESLIKFAEDMGEVGGIFNMALVLQDALFANQTAEKYDAVFRAKIYSGQNLDKLSRQRCPKLDHFVVFSSVVAGRGNPGQSNYGMANSALERLCELRRKDGLPGLAVQYGPVGEVGVVAEDEKYNRSLSSIGLVPQPISSCIDALETFMLQPCAVTSTFIIDERTAESSFSTKSPTETVAHILGIRDLSLIDKNQLLIQIGLDSLMIAEIKQTMYRNFNVELSTEEIRDLTFNQIASWGENLGSAPTEKSTNVSIPNGVNGHTSGPSINAMCSKEAIVEVINNKSNTTKVFFLHPIEGSVDIMLPLARKLKANVYGLQATKDIDSENVQANAKDYIKRIKTIQNTGPYYVCGYSYGGLFGFEIALQLEQQNEKVNLVLIDGTPTLIKRIFQYLYEKNDKSEARSKVNILRGFIKTFDDLDTNKAEDILDPTIPWEEQLERVGDFVAESTDYNSKDIAISAERFRQRVTAAFSYEPTGIFNGQATLFRADDVFKDLPQDYDLQKICKQPIKVEKLSGNHKQILEGNNLLRISEYLNTIFK